MNEFVRKHEDRIHGVLSCFDRMLFRGYLPIMSGWSMAQLLKAHEIDCSSVKPFLLSNAERVKAHAVALAHKHERPFEYLGTKLRRGRCGAQARRARRHHRRLGVRLLHPRTVPHVFVALHDGAAVRAVGQAQMSAPVLRHRQ